MKRAYYASQYGKLYEQYCRAQLPSLCKSDHVRLSATIFNRSTGIL